VSYKLLTIILKNIGDKENMKFLILFCNLATIISVIVAVCQFIKFLVYIKWEMHPEEVSIALGNSISFGITFVLFVCVFYSIY
jgi:hypothetical protein